MAGASGLNLTTAPTADPSQAPDNAVVQTRVDTGGRSQVRVQVSPAPPVDPSDPKPEAPKPDAAAVVDKPADAPVTPERPSWLPAKFADADAMKAATIELATKQGAPGYVIKGLEASESGAEVSAAYAEFEKKIDPNAGKPAEPKVEEQAPKVEEPPKPAPTVEKTEADKKYEVETLGTYVAGMLDTVGLRAVDLSQEYTDNGGKLTEDTYGKFEKAGVARQFLDSFIAGATSNAQALAEKHVVEIKASVGGDAEFGKLATWAAGNMTKDQHEIYSTMTNSGSVVAAKQAVQMLKGWYDKGNGAPPKASIVPNTAPAAVENKGYTSRAEWMKDLNDPRYEKGDKGFHRMVDEKLKHTNISNI